jgi:hypothetical protein
LRKFKSSCGEKAPEITLKEPLFYEFIEASWAAGCALYYNLLKKAPSKNNVFETGFPFIYAKKI